MSLVTDFSPEDLAKLQADQAPILVPLPKNLNEAAASCFRVDPDKEHRTNEPPMEIHESRASAPEFEVRCREGEDFGPVYNVDPDRFEKAKECQPESGEKPIKMSPSNMILRMDDGTLVHRVDGCLGVHHHLIE